jgi:hypothetical protein
VLLTLASGQNINNIDKKQLLIATASGAISGAITPFVTTKTAVILFSAAISGATDYVSQKSNEKAINYKQVVYNFAAGALLGGSTFKKPNVTIFTGKNSISLGGKSLGKYNKKLSIDLSIKTSTINF